MWKGLFEGIKGYKVWKFKTGVPNRGICSWARYSKEGLFSILYRRKCGVVDRREVTRGLRDLLDFKGRYITIAEYDAGLATIEFYCFLGSLPSEDMMINIESFLHTADFSSL